MPLETRISAINLTPPEELNEDIRRYLIDNLALIRNLLTKGEGVSGTFTTVDSKTVTVTNGIITDITP